MSEKRPLILPKVMNSLMADAPIAPSKVKLEAHDGCALYFTSGTTGQPKPILLTHKNLECACITENVHHGQKKEDNFILIPPLYHTGAKMHWFGSLIVGGRAVILRGISPEWIFDAVSEEEGTILWLLVPWVQDILVKLDQGQMRIEDYKLDRLRLLHIGAMPVPPSLIKRWKAYFPHMDYDTTYGLSEATGPNCVHLGIENLHKVGAIGRPGFNWETRIVDESDRDVQKGDVGELLVRGEGSCVNTTGIPKPRQMPSRTGGSIRGIWQDRTRTDSSFSWIEKRM